jgi:hypothetical protein
MLFLIGGARAGNFHLPQIAHKYEEILDHLITTFSSGSVV